MTIRVLLADDQAMVRTGLRLILEDQPDIRVVAEAEDGAAAVALARQHRPDVCLVDIRMPKLNGIEVTQALAGPMVQDPLRVIVVTTFDLDEYVQGALRGGAVGFILKDAGPTLLVEAVRAAFAGEALISPSITLRLLQQFTGTANGTGGGTANGTGGGTGTGPRAGPTSNRHDAAQLSEREVEVVRALARGCTNREIAGELFISLSTVKGHLAGIQGKLGLRNRVEVALWASENRL